MIRTQIYLTEKQRNALGVLARETGRTRSALIREAVDRRIDDAEMVDRRVLLRQARGMWRDRADLPSSADRHWVR